MSNSRTIQIQHRVKVMKDGVSCSTQCPYLKSFDCNLFGDLQKEISPDSGGNITISKVYRHSNCMEAEIETD